MVIKASLYDLFRAGFLPTAPRLRACVKGRNACHTACASKSGRPLVVQRSRVKAPKLVAG